MDKKKILSITCFDVFQGGELRLEMILNFLRKSYEINLLAPEGILTERVNEKIPVTISKGMGQLNRSKNKLWILTLFWRSFVSFFEILYHLICLKPDIVHCSSETSAFYTILPAKILKKKIICELCKVIEQNTFWGKLSLLTGKFVYRYIVASKAVKNRMVEIGHDPQKIIVLNDGIDANNEFNPEKVPSGVFRSKFGIPAEDILIGMTGATYYLKGQHIFLEAANIINKADNISANVRFLIIGGPRVASDEDYLTHLKNYLDENNLSHKVIFTGNIKHELIPHALKDLNLFVFCSCLPDAFPRATVEAMAMKKIVIASNLGGVTEQIEDKVTGFLYTPGNSQELAEKIISVINNYSSINGMGIKAREAAEKRFSDEVFKENLFSIYNKIFSCVT